MYNVECRSEYITPNVINSRRSKPYLTILVREKGEELKRLREFNHSIIKREVT